MQNAITGFERRSQRVRTQIRKRSRDRVRLSIFRSGKHIYAQLIDDAKGTTLAAASTVDKDVKGKVKNGSTVEAAKQVGTLVAQRGLKLQVSKVVFDRAGFLYHGRVKALADAAREAGLVF